MTRQLAPILAIALVIPGCALAIDGPDPRTPVARTPKCDTGRGAVIADGTVATGLAIGGAALVEGDEIGAGVGVLALGGIMVLSAVRGNSAAGRCEAAIGAHDAYVARLGRTQPPPVVAVTPTVRPEAQPGVALPPPLPLTAATVKATPPEQPAEPDDGDDTADTEWSAYWEPAP